MGWVEDGSAALEHEPSGLKVIIVNPARSSGSSLSSSIYELGQELASPNKSSYRTVVEEEVEDQRAQ